MRFFDMSLRVRRPAWSLVATALSGVALLADPAGAQLPGAEGRPSVSRNASGQDGMRPTVPTANLPSVGRREVAPGLPGARARDGTVAPADRPAMQMHPTEALFDSVNRGDIAAARDAIGRGAELGARNILGLTPLDLAVDLGRKDIVFLLLSMRGMEERSGPPPTAATAGARGQPDPRRAEAARRPTPSPAPAPVAARVSAPAVPASPRLFAGDGGSPSPDAGFLGFDGGRGRAR